MPQNINRVILTGNLTRDPELHDTSGGSKVCRMRVACNSRVKISGEWTDKANYVDVACFGAQAENAHKYLAKGRAVAIDGRLDWNEWTTQEGQKRQSLSVIADSVQFLSDVHADGDSGHGPAVGATAQTPVSSAADDDIPF